jgi:hypothetical protein
MSQGKPSLPLAGQCLGAPAEAWAWVSSRGPNHGARAQAPLKQGRAGSPVASSAHLLQAAPRARLGGRGRERRGGGEDEGHEGGAASRRHGGRASGGGVGGGGAQPGGVSGRAGAGQGAVGAACGGAHPAGW